jgi:2-polyprenyl-3-methyl-5-hydroxy-6-metoxy-1,4-benzoquinol methylase
MLLLRRRDAQADEMLDRADCDLRTACTTYRQFGRINAVASRFRHVYRCWMRPQMRPEPARRYTLLDIGFGGGDIALALARWAAADGLTLEVTGIDVNPRALDYAATLQKPPNIVFRQATPGDLLADGERFDFVVSNHLLHHLDDGALPGVLETAARLARRCAVMMDTRRSDAAYVLFAALAPVFLRGSYHRHDGLASLRRAYTASELRRMAPAGWQLQRLIPFRLALIRVPDAPGR